MEKSKLREIWLEEEKAYGRKGAVFHNMQAGMMKREGCRGI